MFKDLTTFRRNPGSISWVFGKESSGPRRLDCPCFLFHSSIVAQRRWARCCHAFTSTCRKLEAIRAGFCRTQCLWEIAPKHSSSRMRVPMTPWCTRTSSGDGNLVVNCSFLHTTVARRRCTVSHPIQAQVIRSYSKLVEKVHWEVCRGRRRACLLYLVVHLSRYSLPLLR